MLAAPFVVGDETRLVPCTDLLHVDATREEAREGGNQFAEVDPILRHEVDGDKVLGEYGFDLDEVHLVGQPVLGDGALTSVTRSLADDWIALQRFRSSIVATRMIFPVS